MKYVVILCGILLLFPLAWLIKGSFEDVKITMRIPPRWVLSELTFENYRILFSRTTIPRWFFNTVIIATMALAWSLFSTILAAHAFASYRFPGRQLIYWLFITSIMIPGHALLVSMFVLMRHLRLIGTWWSLVVTGGCSPVAIVIFMKYLQKIPASFPDAARMDGLGEFGILLRIILPQCKPILGYMLITGYMGAFSSYLWPFIMLTDPRKMTLAVGITLAVRRYELTQTGSLIKSLGVQLAGGVIMFLPVLLIFLVFQRAFKQRFLEGGIKE